MNNARKSHRTALAIFAVILAVAIIAAFMTTLEGVETKQARNVAQPGTIGLAHPHPPLDRAPGEPVRN
jgi:flagellar basal body-associated protein FliL